MAILIRVLLMMSLPTRLITLRKEQRLTQQQMADTTGIHVNSSKKYEAGQAQLSLNALKKMTLTIHVSTDFLLFEAHGRSPSDDFFLQFETLSQFDKEERKDAKSVLESLILKHNAKRDFSDQIQEAQ